MKPETQRLAEIIRRRALDSAVCSMRIEATERLASGDRAGAEQLAAEIRRTIGAFA
jgi:hypothetical protein